MKEIELLKTIFKDSPDILEPLNEIDKEIERLNELVKGLREERDYLFNKTTTESNYEIERLNNIINTAKEYIEDNTYKANGTEYMDLTGIKELLEILDKGE